MSSNLYRTDHGGLSDEKLVQLAQSGDCDAEHSLVVRFMGLVRMKARPYFLVGADRSDLIQEGAIGLCAAIRDYDHEKHVSFRSFAEICINRQLIAAIKRATRQKHIPLNSYISLDKPVYNDDEDNNSSLGDTLMSISASNPEELAVDKESTNHILRGLENGLTELELNVLVRFVDGKSYTEIAESIGRSPKAVDNALQRIKKKVLKLISEQK